MSTEISLFTIYRNLSGSDKICLISNQDDCLGVQISRLPEVFQDLLSFIQTLFLCNAEHNDHTVIAGQKVWVRELENTNNDAGAALEGILPFPPCVFL